MDDSCKLMALKFLCDLRNLFLPERRSPEGLVAATSNNAEGQEVTERVMADFGTQTEFEPKPSFVVPAPRIIELKETTKPIVSKVSFGIFLLFQGNLNSEQRKAPRTSVRNTAEMTPPDTTSQSQAPADLPSPAKPKRARIATKREKEKEEPTFVEPVSRGGAELVG